MFSVVARHLATHIAAAEERCRSLEQVTLTMKNAIMVTSQEDSTAAAGWWWQEYTSLRDAIISLIDGKVRHDYDRPKVILFCIATSSYRHARTAAYRHRLVVQCPHTMRALGTAYQGARSRFRGL
ncbi:unnamed protein product [Laminaria digitata]